MDLINVWRHSEIAGKNSVFCDIGLSPIMFDDLQLNVLPVDLRAEFFPPIPIPFAFGIFMKTPNPNLKSFGLRIAYHFDVLDSVTDLYAVYSHDFGYLRNELLIQYNDTPVEEYKYDFRIGVRRFFDSWIGLAVETGFHFESIIIMLSIKIN
jgi:hypothetical protein